MASPHTCLLRKPGMSEKATRRAISKPTCHTSRRKGEELRLTLEAPGLQGVYNHHGGEHCPASAEAPWRDKVFTLLHYGSKWSRSPPGPRLLSSIRKNIVEGTGWLSWLNG